MAGLPGSGKSWLAGKLAPLINADILDRDRIRDSIFPPHDVDYSDEQNELASQVTYQVAEYILSRHPTRYLILDGRPFSRNSQIERVREMATRLNQSMKIIHCWAPDEIVKQRLERDLEQTKNKAANRTMEKYYRIKALFEPIRWDHLTVDTSQPLDTVIRQVLIYLDIPACFTGHRK